ncbi:MAG: DNA recombination protein RmuC, partial [Thermodesulfobacteriota bacterium]
IEAKEKLAEQFENLGNRIFESNTKKFSDNNKMSLENLLNPLRDQIKDFDKKISDTYEKESKERVLILNQIENLKNLNNKISQDAINLTNALKGESKTQGTWGEVVLEKVLEMSGLVKGREYEAQENYFRAWDDKRFRPDVIVHLPEGKQVVIDSKVSLKAYEEYSSSLDENEKSIALKNHISSINNHIKNLGSKGYEDLKGINSLNYVLMFIPIESAFMLAIENDKEIFKSAFDKNIILVCPSTLLATLRTVQSIWQFEYQNRNAQDIADRAGKLFDRFVEFVDHLEKVGRSLNQATKSYEDSIKALSTGKGNLIKQVTQLEELGIKNRKKISSDILEQSDTLDIDERDNFKLNLK